MSIVRTPLAILRHFVNATCSLPLYQADNFIKRVNFSFSSFTSILHYIVVIVMLHFAIYLYHISVIVDFINIPHTQSA